MHIGQLLEAVRRLLSKERYACNLLFLGQFDTIRRGMHEHLCDLGEELDRIYVDDDLGASLGEGSIAEVNSAPCTVVTTLVVHGFLCVECCGVLRGCSHSILLANSAANVDTFNISTHTGDVCATGV